MRCFDSCDIVSAPGLANYPKTTSSLAYSLWLGHVGTCKELPKG